MGKVEKKIRPRLTNIGNCELGRVKGQKQVCGVELKRKNIIASPSSSSQRTHVSSSPTFIDLWNTNRRFVGWWKLELYKSVMSPPKTEKLFEYTCQKMELCHFFFRLGLDLKVALSALTFTNSTSFTEKSQQHQPWITMSEHNNLTKLEHQGYSQQRERSKVRAQSLHNNRQYFPRRRWKCKEKTLKNKWRRQAHNSLLNAIQDKDFCQLRLLLLT